MARAQRAWCLAERGEFREGTESGEEGVRLAETFDHPFTLLSTCAFLAYLHRVKGDLASSPACADPEVAAAHYLQAMGTAPDLGMRPLLAHCHPGLGILYRSTGKTPQAQEHMGAAIAMCREMDMRVWMEKTEVEVRA